MTSLVLANLWFYIVEPGADALIIANSELVQTSSMSLEEQANAATVAFTPWGSQSSWPTAISVSIMILLLYYDEKSNSKTCSC